MSRSLAVAAVLAALAVASVAQAAETVVLQLQGPAQFRFAGYYAALWQGYYRDAGFDVTIRPGSDFSNPSIDPAREVAEGRAEFGTGTADLVIRAAQGMRLLLLAPIFQQSGAGIYYRADASYPSPAALAKARVGRLPASNILDIELATALRAEAIEGDRLKPVPLQPGEAVAALAGRRVDAAPGSAWEVPWLAREKGLSVQSFNPADYRVEFYGDTLFTSQRLFQADPETVRRFREASLKGWEYALRNPDEIGARLLSELPRPPGIADAGGFTRHQAELAKSLARYPEVELGHSNIDRWRSMQASMLGVGALLRTADPEEFVFNPDADLRRRTDRRALAIISGALVLGLAVTVWLWRIRRRGRNPAHRAPAGGTVAAPALPGTTSTEAVPPAPAPRTESPTDLNALLEGIEREMRRVVPRRATLRLSLIPQLWQSRAEARTVRRLVLDLVAAAAADLRRGRRDRNGELVVGTRNVGFDAAAIAATPGARLGEFARLTVRDNGPGLSDEALERILDPDASVRPAVAAAALAVQPFDGFVRVETAEGVGTAIHLYFPRLAATAEPTAPVQAAE